MSKFAIEEQEQEKKNQFMDGTRMISWKCIVHQVEGYIFQGLFHDENDRFLEKIGMIESSRHSLVKRWAHIPLAHIKQE
jgi:phosphoribosylpyrophosphate synthetase